MKNLLFACAVCAFVLVIRAHDATAEKVRDDSSGDCGDGVKWSFSESSGTLSITGEGFMYDYSYSSTPLWYSWRNSIKTINVNEGVKSIGIYAFAYANNLTSVTLPESLVSIGEQAFFYCISLTSLTIPANVEIVNDKAFGYCMNLKSLEVDERNPYFKSVDGVLIDKVNNTLIVYPGGKEGEYIIPSFITSIHSNAFYQSYGLTSVVIPDNVTSVGDAAFYRCEYLRSVIITAKATSIGHSVFYGCTSLTSVLITSDLTSIGGTVFGMCTSIKSLSYLGTYDPGVGVDICDNYGRVPLICVPPSYNSSSFGGHSIACKSNSCDLIQPGFNHCYELLDGEDQCSASKTTNATLWESQSNACVEYKCINDIGIVATYKCSGDEQCINNECGTEPSEKQWVVVIDIDNSDGTPIDTKNIKTDISELTSVDESKIDISVEYDSDGRVIRVEVLIDDKSTAEKINAVLSEQCHGEPCKGVLCRCKETHIEEINSPLSLSEINSPVSLSEINSPLSLSLSDSHMNQVSKMIFICLVLSSYLA